MTPEGGEREGLWTGVLVTTDTREAAGGPSWEYRLPVLTNVFLWYDLAKVFLIDYLVIVALMATIFLAAGDPGSIVKLARIFALVCAGLFVASMPIAALWYANRVHVRYELSPKGVRYQNLERKDRVANRALFVLGLLSGKPAAAGAGLLAASRETEFTRWRDVTRVREHVSLGVVTLMNSWRVVQRLHCRRENYQQVVSYVRDHVTRPRGR
jgi:hypothetical protein